MARDKGVVEKVTERVQDFEEEVEDKIRERPVQSVMIAFGVGLLAGAIVAALMSRK